MLFNSWEFAIFFPLVTGVFFLSPQKYRWFILLAASCAFYMAFIPVYIFILFFTIIVDYIAGLMIEGSIGRTKSLFLMLSIFINVGTLAFFKYFNFFTDNINHLISIGHLSHSSLHRLNIILPIGLSFHTFQAMSYTIEVYRGNQKAERHFGIYALYVMFYPQLVAGPIERPQNMLHQFHEKHYFDYKSVTDGLKLMLWGMVKKVVIADRLAIITDPVFNSPHNYPAITLLIAAFFFSFQIFCDFSGYSDIALGAAQVMGFRLMVNFKRPYHSRSVSEFWTRWHISLSTWFRDYLYIPLGGNRVGVPRWYFNLYFVFLVSGFWHGANWTFIVWGALHGIYLIVALTTAKFRTRLTEKTGLSAIPWLNQSLQIISTFVLVMIAWVFFRANNIKDAVYILTRLPLAAKDFLHSVKTHQIWLGKIGEEYLTPGFFVPSFLLILFMEAVHIFQSRTSPIAFLDRQPIYIRWAVYYSILILLWTGATESRQFIYFQF